MAKQWTPPSDAEVTENNKFVPPSDAVEVKKKEVSQSTLNQSNTSSDRLSKTTTKPTASLSLKGDGTYTFPGQEGVIFEKKDNQWSRKEKDSYEFKPINKVERVNNLEKRAVSLDKYSFEEAPAPKIEQTKFQAAPKAAPKKPLTQTEKAAQTVFKQDFSALDLNSPEYLERKAEQDKINNSISNVDLNLVGMNEEDVVPKLKESIKDYPYLEVDESGIGYDEILVRNKVTGESKKISLDNWTTDRDNEESKILRGFLDTQMTSKGYTEAYQRVNNLRSQIADATPTDRIELTEKLVDAQAKLTEEKNKRAAYVRNDKYLSAAIYDKNAQENIKTDLAVTQLRTEDYKEKVNQYNEFSTNVNESYAQGKISREDYYQNYVPKLKAEKETLVQEQQKLRNDYLQIKTDQQSVDEVAGDTFAIESERGNVLTGAASAVLKGIESSVRFGLEGISEEAGGAAEGSLQGVFQQLAPGSVSNMYTNSANRNTFEQIVFGLAESGGAAMTGVAAGGPAGSLMGLYASSYTNMKDQMNTEAFKDVPEWQKILMSSVYGGTVGILEEIGLSKWFTKTPAGKGLTNWILKKVITELPKDATAEAIDLAVKKSFKTAVANGLIQVTSTGLVEGSTELSQEAADMVYKDVFNKLNGKEFFDKPNTWEGVFSRLGENFKLGFLGGAGMQSITQTTQTAKNAITMNQLNNIENLIENPNIKDIYKMNLKDQILSGEITSTQAKEQLQKLDELEATVNKIPNNVKAENKYQAFQLLNEREDIQKEIAGKDPALVAAQTERINAINDELKTISQNAVQEQTTSEVPLQPRAEVGGEVAQGESQAGPEVITEEGIQEEKVATYRAEEQAELLNAIPEIENYKVNGEIDKSLMPAEVLAKYDEIYNKYDELISPLLETTAQINVAPLFNTKVTNIEEAKAIQNSDQYKQYKEKIGTVASDFGIKVDNIEDSIGGYAGVSEVSNIVNVTGDWNSIVEFAAVFGAMTPEVQDSTIAGRSIESGSEFHNTDRYEVQIDNQEAAMKAAADAGFDQEGFTLTGNKIMFFNIFEYPVEDFDNKYVTFVDKYIEYGGQVGSETKSAIQSEFIDSDRRAEIITKIEGNAVQQTGREGVRNAVQEAKPRNEEYIRRKNPKQEISLNLVTADNINDVIAKQDTAVKQKIAKSAKLVMKAIPGSNIYLHETKEDFDQAVGETTDGTERGAFIPSDGSIHINMQAALPHTLLHEAFHAVVLSKKLDNDTLNSWTKGLKGIVKDKALLDRLNNLTKLYSAEEQSEEFISELGSIMSEAQKTLTTSGFQKFKVLINKIATKAGLPPIFTAASTAQDAVDFINTVSGKLTRGEEIYVNDPGDGGEVGTFNIPDAKFQKAKSVADDPRDFIREFVQDVDLREFNGQKFITNMYDYTNAGKTDLGNGFSIDMLGGKNYVPLMMSLNGKVIGDVSNLAAFNTKEQAETFIRNSEMGGAKLFAPHAGTLDNSWQFQQHTFAELFNLVLDAGILTPNELIDVFNSTIKGNKDNQAQFNQFAKKYGEDIKSFDLFESDPKKIVDLLDIKNNYSPKLRKALNNAIASNKKFQQAIGVNNKNEFYQRIMDPLNQGMTGGEIMNIVEFDPNTFEIVETKPNNTDHHPSFGFALLAKINGIYQPTQLFKSVDVTESYTKYNKGGEEISRKAEEPKFEEKNVSSSAGAIPKTAELDIKRKKQLAPRNEAIQKAKEKYNLSVKERGNTKEQGVNSALEDLRKSDWYNKADDIQREESERELKKFFGQKIKSAPSINKITGVKPTKIQVDEAAALKSQLRLEARAARDAKTDLNTKRKQIATFIRSLKTKGTIIARQASALVKRASSLNLDNSVMIVRFENYAEKVFQRAEYQDLLTSAFKVRRLIRKAIKSENQAEVVGMAKLFSKIDPSLVDDIDNYIELAGNVLNAVRPSKEKGMDVALRQAANIETIAEYANEEITKQEENRKRELMSEYNYLVDSGVLTEDLSVKEMQEIINLIDNPTAEFDPEADQKKLNFLQNRLASMEAVFRYMLANNINPFTGEDVVVDPKDADLIKRLLKMDLNEMSVRDAAKVVEAMDNFLMNNITSGLEAAVRSYEGAQNVKQLVTQGKKARKLKSYFNETIGEFFGEQMISLPLLFEKMFNGIKNSANIMQMMGLTDVINGSNKAVRQHNDLMTEYSKQDFYKEEGFMEAKNVYERGMLAFLKRNLTGTKTQIRDEFKRRAEIIKQSIDSLIENGTDKEKEMADLYQETYDKLGVSELDLDVIEARAEKMNKAATAWMINEWGEIYGELADVSLSVYNSMLGSDTNYTPDRYKSLSSEDQGLDEALLNSGSGFMMSMDYTDKNKTGVLMEATRPKVLPMGRYISLDFDVNNFNSLKGALVDINTASAIRQVDGFINSKAFKKLIPEAKDRKILTKRINTYIQKAKGKRTVTSDTIKDVERLTNFITGLGVGKALGGLDQPIKQTIPVMINTFINSNGNMTFVNADMNEAINRSGMPIANRGLEAQTTVQSIDRLLEKKGGLGAEAIKKIEDINQFWLKTLLAKPDVWIARSSFITYYLKDMKSKGENVKDIDWSTHQWNKDSAQYAQLMVDRQQNISDDKLAGDFLSSDDPTKRIARKVIMPFATFIMNQKARMHNDFLTLRSKDSSIEDRKSAAKSLAGLGAELAAYQLIGYGIKTLVYDSIANALVGDDEEEEKKDKSLLGLKLTAKQYSATKFPVKSIVGDILSPLPIFDELVTFGFDKVMERFPQISNEDINKAVEEKNSILRLQGKDEMDDNAKTKFIDQLKSDNIYSVAFKNDNQAGRAYGMVGIAYDTYKELIDLSAMAYTGEFEDEYQGRVTNKYLPEEDRKILQNISVPLMILYSTGIAPKDLGTVARKVTNIVKKKGVTENQHEKDKEVKKQINRDLSEWEFELVKTRKKTDGIVDEINYVESKGGLDDKQGKEYVKLMEAFPSPSDDMLRDIQKGMTADQIIKKNKE